MTKFTTALMTTALVLGTASSAFADQHKDKVKDMAVDEAAKRVEQPLKSKVGETAGDATIDMAKDMAKGKSMTDSAMDAGTDAMMPAAGSMSTDDAMTAGKVMMKGGTVQDAGRAVAVDRAKTMASDTINAQMKKPEGSMIDGRVDSTDTMVKTTTTLTPAPAVVVTPAPAAVPAMAPVNCPSGTTAQPDGTCMITGDFDVK